MQKINIHIAQQEQLAKSLGFFQHVENVEHVESIEEETGRKRKRKKLKRTHQTNADASQGTCNVL